MLNKKIILILFMFCFYECSVQNSEVNISKTYIFSENNREISIKFIDNQNLIIKNIFNCDNVNIKYKEFSIKKKYTLTKNKIIITNFSKNDSIVLPYFESSNCFFLGEEYRTTVKNKMDGAKYYPNKSLYTVPNIDFLTIYNGNLIYYKEDSIGSVGFIFSPN